METKYKAPKTPAERLEQLVANEDLTGEEVLDFLDDENFILINRIATENPDNFYLEYAEFIDFYFDVFGFNEDFMNYVDEYYEDDIPFLFEFADDCCRKRELANMSDSRKDNARTMKEYIMKIPSDRSLIAHLGNDIVLSIDIPKKIPKGEWKVYNREVEDVCMHLACFEGQAFLIYTDPKDSRKSVINGFMSLNGVMANISENNMKSSFSSSVKSITEKKNLSDTGIRFGTSSCIFKKPQFGKPRKEKDDDFDGKIIHFPAARLKG